MSIKTDVTIGVTLEEAALDSFLRMLRDGMPLAITSDYRDPELQKRLFKENYIADFMLSAKYDGRSWDGVTYWRRYANARTGGPTVAVAVPDTSEHEKGLALDAATPARAWLHKNGRKYGWVNPEWAKNAPTFEPWHFEYVDALNTMKDQPVPEEEEMPRFIERVYQTDQKLKNGEWKTLRSWPTTDYAYIVSGNGTYDIRVNIQVGTLPAGAELRARFYREKDGKRVGTYGASAENIYEGEARLNLNLLERLDKGGEKIFLEVLLLGTDEAVFAKNVYTRALAWD